MADAAVELCTSVTTTIKRVDPYVKDILAQATHVALYRFNLNTSQWEKTQTEGALFVYSRNGEPYNSIMVMNRLNTENTIEPIVKEFEYQMQVPFLLFKNYRSKIFGVWFFNREECIRVTFWIETIMKSFKDQSQEKNNSSSSTSSSGKKQNEESGVDIFSLLTKAQEDFNKTPTKQDHHHHHHQEHPQAPQHSGGGGGVAAAPPLPGTPAFSTPRAPLDCTSKSVMDFFAKASTKTHVAPAPSAAGPVMGGGGGGGNAGGSSAAQHHVRPPPIVVGGVGGGGGGESVLQRLMSNPAHSVEHIEKQQRSITPQEQVQPKQHKPNSDSRRSVPITFPQQQHNTAGSGGATLVENKRQTTEISHHPTSVENTANLVNTGSLSPNSNPNFQASTSPLTFLFQGNSNHAQKFDESSSNNNPRDMSSPFAQFLDNAQQKQNSQKKPHHHQNNSKPQLMTPRMFTPSSSSRGGGNNDVIIIKEMTKAADINSILNSSRTSSTTHMTTSSGGDHGDENGQIDLLTEKQLAQALIHLLKTNAGFTRQIHEAYVNSIMERVNLNGSSSGGGASSSFL